MRRYTLYQVCSVRACTAHGMMVRLTGSTPLDAMHSSEITAKMHRHGLQNPQPLTWSLALINILLSAWVDICRWRMSSW